MSANSYHWSVAIFSARESISVLESCIRAAIAACDGQSFIIDVLVNGNRPLSDQAVGIVNGIAEMPAGGAVRVWHLPVGDKAQTWNQYVHNIWPGSTAAFFIDGYADVFVDALSLLNDLLIERPDALGAAAVPTSGRAATANRAAMVRSGGIQGALFALTAEAMLMIQQVGFVLPMGLYRTDGFIGAALMYRFDPGKYQWDKNRVVVHPDASFTVKKAPLLSLGNLIGQFKRRLRQAQGDLENRAAREHMAVRRLPPATMPKTVNEVVGSWIAMQPKQARQLFVRHPLTYLAANKMAQGRDWSTASAPPQLLWMTPSFDVAADTAQPRRAVGEV